MANEKADESDLTAVPVSSKKIVLDYNLAEGKGGYFKDERSLGGRGGRQNAVSISNNDVIV